MHHRRVRPNLLDVAELPLMRVIIVLLMLAGVAHADEGGDPGGGFNILLGTRVGNVEDKATFGGTERVYAVQSLTWANFGDDTKLPGAGGAMQLDFGQGSDGGVYFSYGFMLGHVRTRRAYATRLYAFFGGDTLQDRHEYGTRGALGAELILRTRPAHVGLMAEYGGRLRRDDGVPIELRMNETGPASRVRASVALRHMQGDSEPGLFTGPLVSVEYEQSFDARILWLTFGTSIDYRMPGS